jgi:dihydrolipoamide dehydrogenase
MKQVVVIGGGPAGVEAARAAAQAGAKVTIISDGPVGGRAGWHSLLPSKVWLAAADTISRLETAPTMGIQHTAPAQPDPEAIHSRIRQVKATWNQQLGDSLLALGVQIFQGIASFDSVRQITVKGEGGDLLEQFQPEAIIIATGSVPIFPGDLRPDGERVLAPRFASHLHSLPEDIIVIGAGATGSEFAYLFHRMGVKTTWIVDQFGILPTFASEAGAALGDALRSQGMRIHSGHQASRLEKVGSGVTVYTEDGTRHRATMAFLAIGRKPDLGRLNLEATGTRTNLDGSIHTDGFGRSNVPQVYAVGDAAGLPMTANKATIQAWIAGRHAAGERPQGFRPSSLVHAVYTQPQVAQVGVIDPEGTPAQSVRLPYPNALEALLLPKQDGFIRLTFTGEERRILGGLSVGDHAADVLAPIALAVQMGASIDDLAASSFAHPTLSELVTLAARAV